ncbi:MAG: EamA family transporter, partial [Nitrospinota bacterium]
GGGGGGGGGGGPGVVSARTRGQLFAVATCLLWGSTAVLFKLGGRGLPALDAAAISLLVGSGGVLLLWALSRSSSRPAIPRRAWRFLLAAAAFQSAAVPFYYAALFRLEAATVAAVNSTQPLLSLTLAFLFLREMERITRRVVAGALLCVAGTLLVLR